MKTATACCLWAALLWATPVAAHQLTDAAPLPGDASIAPLAGGKWEPCVAAGDGLFLAVWADERAALETTVELDPWEVVQSDVYALRLGPDGVPLDAAPIRVDSSPYSQVAPRAAWNGSAWLVAYETRSVSSTGFYTTQDLAAVRVSPAGEVLDATPLVIDATDGQAYVPSVASDGDGWAVFWRDDAGIAARRVAADGALGPAVDASGTTEWVFDSAAAFAGDRYLLVWERTAGTYGRLLDAALRPLSGIFTVSSGTDPEIATDGTDFFVTTAAGVSWPEIRGSIVRHDGSVPNPAGATLDGFSYLSLGSAATAWDGGGYQLAWIEWRYVFPDGPVHSLRWNRVDADGVPTPAAPLTLLESQDFSINDPVLAGAPGGGAFVGWMDTRLGTSGIHTGFGTVVDASGAFPAGQCWMTGPRAQYAPDLVAGPRGATLAEDVNLLVYVSADADETRVVFQRVDGAGAAIDAEPVVVAGGTDRYRNPVAAWNGGLWLVVWEDRHGGTGNGGTLGRRVAPDGTFPDKAPFAILEGNDPDVGALATEGGGFLVAASHLTSGDIRTIWARRVGADGSLPDASKLGIGSDFAMAATVEGFDDRWMVAWYRRPTHDTPSSTLQARMVTAGGSVLPLLDPTNSTADELAPDLFIAGDVATLAWSDGTDIRVRQILKDGTGLGSPAGVVVSAAPEEQTAPTVTGDGAKLTVTWVDDRAHGVFEPGVGDLYAARLDAGLGVLEPLGIALAADGKAAEGEAGLVGHLGVTLVAYPAVLPESGGWRVLTGTLRDWDPMGHELPGASGPPRLWMSGLLVQGSTLSARISDAAPSAPGLLILGGSAADLPFKGGVLVPQPTFLLPIATNALGAANLSAPLATPLPSGVDLYVQAWLADAGGPAGLSATAAFHAVTP